MMIRLVIAAAATGLAVVATASAASLTINAEPTLENFVVAVPGCGDLSQHDLVAWSNTEGCGIAPALSPALAPTPDLSPEPTPSPEPSAEAVQAGGTMTSEGEEVADPMDTAEPASPSPAGVPGP